MLLKVIKKTDAGTEFGKWKSPDSFKLYYKFNCDALSLLCNQINKKKVLLADYGGANSILGTQLVKLLEKKKINVKIENIDFDESKFVESKNIKNICADFIHYKKKECYDFAMSRYTLHYLSKAQQLKLLNNIYYNLKPKGYLLLIMFITVGDDYKVKSNIERILNNQKGINREMFNINSFLDIVLKSKFEIVDFKKFDYDLKINDFYKYRFNLNNKEIKELENKIKKKSFSECQVALLLRKD
jgi:SAM-dependent methyltransferase